MAPEQDARISLGWSRERLAVESGVSVASIYLLERALTAGPDEDARIREALVVALVRRWNGKRLSAREMVVLSRTYLPEVPLLS
jgi:transcriptional regulator with XRE-family HTH domain